MSENKMLPNNEQQYVDDVIKEGKRLSMGELNTIHDELSLFIRSGSGEVKVVMMHQEKVVFERNSIMFSSKPLKLAPEEYQVVLKFLYLFETNEDRSIGLSSMLREINRLLPKDCPSILTTEQDSNFSKEMFANNEKLKKELEALDAYKAKFFPLTASLNTATPSTAQRKGCASFWKRLFG